MKLDQIFALMTVTQIGLVIHCQLSSSSIDFDLLVRNQKQLFLDEDHQIVPNKTFSHENTRWLNFRDEFESLIQEASKDLGLYLSHPVNEFLLIKRMFESSEFYNSNSTIGSKLPSKDDVSRASLSLLRLQKTYKLDTLHLGNGRLSGPNIQPRHSSNIQSNNQMNAGDCLEMGRISYLIGADDYAVDWLEKSLRHYALETHKTADKADILQYYAFAAYKQGNVELSSELTKELLLQLGPQASQDQLKEIYDDTEELRGDAIVASGMEEHDETYEALCREEVIMDQSTTDQLFCSYTYGSSAFLKLQPVKQEVMSLHPQIVIYHDLISDDEIEIFKLLSQPKLRRLRASSSFTGTVYPEASERRVGYGTQLNFTEHSAISRINRRLKHLTGIVHSLEEQHRRYWQVLKYGVGGHFSPHCDYIRNETFVAEEGNVLATFMFYLNDVEIGGSTVFPLVKTRIPASKGSAVLWYNFYSNGKGNPTTLHASCPVLLGSKWVAAHFFDTREQDLRGQCQLNYDSDQLITGL